MMKWLQKLGKALMLPVAALPVCGILMGIGYALAPAVMGAEGSTTGAAYTIGFLLVKAGGALIDNMAWLFAIGAAVGLAKMCIRDRCKVQRQPSVGNGAGSMILPARGKQRQGTAAPARL